MLAKKVLSAFLTDLGQLDFDLFEKLLEGSQDFLDEVFLLSEHELNLLFKILTDAKRPSALAKIFSLLESKNLQYNHSTAVLSLIKLGFFNSKEDLIKEIHLLNGLEKENAFQLHSFSDLFPEKHQQIIESSLSLQRQKADAFKEDLIDQVEFLKTAQLNDKALEIEQKLKFHFPDTTKTLISPQQVETKSKEHNYSKIIERNLSFEARSATRRKHSSSKHLKTLKEEADASLELANLWYSELKDSNPELLLTQLEFINFKNPDFYLRMLKETNLDVWTKIFLYIKSENYLEGLEFLGLNETQLLTESSDSIYNYYYTKGVMLLGAGMQKEAEEIFVIIKEQKGNFRDIQLLLQNAK